MEPPARTLLLELLLDLANDASAYLRKHGKRAVRVSAALLVAGSLAACSGLPALPGASQGGGSVVQPLSSEVRTGMPAEPGRYRVTDSSVSRDSQGIYRFTWISPDGPRTANVSRLRLAQSEDNVLEVPASGDPILYLRPQNGIPLGGGSSGTYGTWYPFYGIGSSTPAYFDPPTRALAPGSTVRGSSISSAPTSPGERTVGAPHSVSGRAGGTGSGQAATNKSGASVSSGKSGGAAAAKSGGFSSGKGGGASGASS
jgi:hypothetical protein